MTKNEISERLVELKNETDHKLIQKEIKQLSEAFYNITNEEEREIQIKNNSEDSEEYFKLDDETVAQNEAIKEQLTEIKAIAISLKDAQQNEEKENLTKKQVILKRFQMLLQNEENLGTLFNSIKEIREEWKDVGNIPKAKFQDIQSQYSQLNELFNYNVNIYKELKENDLKKNFSLKNQIIHQAKELLGEENLRKLDTEVKKLQNEWEEIGPTFSEHWEKLKEEYWSTIKAIYDKINALRDAKEAEKAQNLEKKKELISEVESFIQQIPDSHKLWDAATKSMNDFMDKWKKIGYAPKEVNDQIWKEFRGHFDSFYNAKSKFYEDRKEENTEKKKLKEEIVSKAEALIGMTNWKEGTNLAKKLQQEWKRVGHAGQYAEQKLWKAFREKCDAFFDAKEKYYADLDAANQGNLEQKKALIEEIKAFKRGENPKENIAALKDFAARFAAIGNVPFKEKDSVYKAYKEALDAQYDQLKISGKEKEKVLFQAKLDSIKGAADPSNLLQKEKNFLRGKINELTKEVANFENNLGFFGNSKGAEALLAGVMKNIEKGKADIEELKNKLKSITKMEKEGKPEA